LSSSPEHLEPLAYSVAQVVELTGLKRTYIYELAASGELRAVRSGRRILIDAQSVRDWFAKLPEHAS
jgi:excisionase family DNA binding protein